MNFFERQHAARGTSVKLVLLFALGVASIVAVVDVLAVLAFGRSGTSALVKTLIGASLVTLGVIAVGTLTKMLALRAGGAAVARSVGATPVDPSTQDPRLRRFVNVVQEMSIASGVPVPQLFVLDHEPGINAFAAGYTPADAAVTVTAGALDRLSRDELQGVIGHEFSHVLNGDMRLNIRLMGLLNGILLLGLVGLRFLQFGGGGRDRDRNGSALLLVAVVFMVLGFVGQFFAGLIQAAVSRQREWLADASAVQFTRNTTGLAGALKKIAGLPQGSALSDAAGQKQVAHMLFGEGRHRVSGLYATHPPLLERIAALEPGFDAAAAEQLQQQWAQHQPDGLAEDAAAGLVDSSSGPPRSPATPAEPAGGPTPTATPGAAAITGPALVDRVGMLTPADLAAAGELSARIPSPYRQAAAAASTALPLVLAVVASDHPSATEAQLRIVATRLGQPAADAAAGLLRDLPPLAAEQRLAVISLAVPQLVRRPAADRQAIVATLDELARIDGVIDVFEYATTRVVGKYLLDAQDPAGRSRPGASTVAQVQQATFALLAVVAAFGNADPSAADRAYRAAAAQLLRGTGTSVPPFAPPRQPWQALDAGWPLLRRLSPRDTAALVAALVTAVRDDGVLTATEAELLRVTCAMLDAPLPPLVG